MRKSRAASSKRWSAAQSFGVPPWKTDRHGVGSVIPANAVTGKSYSGINVPILWASADSNGYPSHGWMTFKQARDHGAHVRKGEHGTHVDSCSFAMRFTFVLSAASSKPPQQPKERGYLAVEQRLRRIIMDENGGGAGRFVGASRRVIV